MCMSVCLVVSVSLFVSLMSILSRLLSCLSCLSVHNLSGAYRETQKRGGETEGGGDNIEKINCVPSVPIGEGAVGTSPPLCTPM